MVKKLCFYASQCRWFTCLPTVTHQSNNYLIMTQQGTEWNPPPLHHMILSLCDQAMQISPHIHNVY